MPIKQPITGAKLKARKAHWEGVRAVLDEFSKQYIHQGLRIKDIVRETHMSPSTVGRFFHRGRGHGAKGYNWLYGGPRATTLWGIAAALDMEVIVRPAHRQQLKRTKLYTPAGAFVVRTNS